MKTVTLNVWDRAHLIAVVRTQAGDLEHIRKWLKVLEALSLSEKERLESEYIELPNGQVAWKRGEIEKEIELEDELLGMLKEAAVKFGQWPIDDRVLAVMEKLEKKES